MPHTPASSSCSFSSAAPALSSQAVPRSPRLHFEPLRIARPVRPTDSLVISLWCKHCCKGSRLQAGQGGVYANQGRVCAETCARQARYVQHQMH